MLKFCSVSVLLMALAFPATARGRVGIGLGLRHEPGVETRLPLTLSGELAPCRSVRVAAALGSDLTRSPVPDRFGLTAGWSPVPPLELTAGTVLRRWPAWRAGENTAFLSARASPLARLTIEAGIARRVPLLDTFDWRSPFVWSGSLAEWNLVYGLDWQAIDSPAFRLNLGTGNREPLALRTPDLLRFQATADHSFRSDWTATVTLAVEMKGFSSVLATLGAIEMKLGVIHEL